MVNCSTSHLSFHSLSAYCRVLFIELVASAEEVSFLMFLKVSLPICCRFTWLLPITLVLRCFRISSISLSSHSILALFHSFWNSGSSLSKTCGRILLMFNLAGIRCLETALLRASRCLCLCPGWPSKSASPSAETPVLTGCPGRPPGAHLCGWGGPNVLS